LIIIASVLSGGADPNIHTADCGRSSRA
jgi:hypothetical protein